MDETFVDLKFLLLEKFHILERLSLQEAQKIGFDTKDMIMSSRVATLLDNGINTVSKLSKTLGISRQATHKAIGNLVDSGFVDLKEHSTNKKIKLIELTPLGVKAFEKRKDLLQDIEDKIAKKIGKEKLDDLKEILMLDWDMIK